MKSIYLKLILLLTALPISAIEIIIEAESADTSSTGPWYSASGASMPYNGNRGRYTLAGGEAKTYTFSANISESGSYLVSVYNSCYTPRSHQVIHRIQHANGVATHIVDQDCATDPFVGQWRPLGEYEFNAGGTASLTIDTTDSNNRYIGATAVRFSNDESPPQNTPPNLTLTPTELTIDAYQQINITAAASDAEDGDLSHDVQWSALGQTFTGAQLQITAPDYSFQINAFATDSQGAIVSESISVTVNQETNPQQSLFEFDCQALEPLTGFTTNNAAALPNVGKRCGRYIAELTDNSNNQTLHFNQHQGRFDGVLATMPFTAIARNVGIAPMNQPNQKHEPDGTAYNFVGLQIHHTNLDEPNSVHLVVGQRGQTQNTIEGKMTFNGSSNQSDIGHNILPDGRADIRIDVSANGQITAYWQQPNTSKDPSQDNWIAYNGTGNLPGTVPNWEGQQVYVGLITYAYYTNGVPFMGVIDALEILEE